MEAVKDVLGGSNPALAQAIAKDHPGIEEVTISNTDCWKSSCNCLVLVTTYVEELRDEESG